MNAFCFIAIEDTKIEKIMLNRKYLAKFILTSVKRIFVVLHYKKRQTI